MKLKDETVYIDADGRYVLNSARMLKKTNLVVYLFMAASFLYHVTAVTAIVVAYLFAGEAGRWVAYLLLTYFVLKASAYTVRQSNQKELHETVNQAIDTNAVRKLPVKEVETDTTNESKQA